MIFPSKSDSKIPPTARGNEVLKATDGAAFSEPVPLDDVKAQLERILASRAFHASQRCRTLLKYVVEMAMDGRASELKERTIGVEVFGRPASYDPGVDAIVRVRFGEVRRRLNLYYAGAGEEDGVRIELPAGSYVPEFRLSPQEEQVVVPRAPRGWLWPAIAAAAAVLLGAGWILFRNIGGDSEPTLRLFWGPALHAASPMQVCLSHVPVYWLKPSREATSTPPKSADDFLILRDRFIGEGDTTAAIKIVSMAHRLGMAYNSKVGEIPFQDLRTSPAVLIGYSCTRWSALNKEMRFVHEFAEKPFRVIDTRTGRSWAPPRPEDRMPNEDYAIVTRTFHPDTGTLMVMFAGIDCYGTDAASDLVTQESLLAEAVHGAQADWPRRNMQLVLHLKVIAGAPGSPRVVDRHIW